MTVQSQPGQDSISRKKKNHKKERADGVAQV
jgi:hypothetical protein